MYGRADGKQKKYEGTGGVRAASDERCEMYSDNNERRRFCMV